VMVVVVWAMRRRCRPLTPQQFSQAEDGQARRDLAKPNHHESNQLTHQTLQMFKVPSPQFCAKIPRPTGIHLLQAFDSSLTCAHLDPPTPSLCFVPQAVRPAHRPSSHRTAPLISSLFPPPPGVDILQMLKLTIPRCWLFRILKALLGQPILQRSTKIPFSHPEISTSFISSLMMDMNCTQPSMYL